MYYLNNNIEDFIKYTNKVENIEEIMNYGDFELSTKLNDDELIDIVLKRLNFDSMDEVINFFNRKENIEKVKELKNIKRISQRQLSRIIGVNNKLIAKYWSED